MAFNKELLEILACPKCKGTIQITVQEDALICEPCKLKYEIRNEIPVMLVNEATSLEETTPVAS